MKTILKFSIFCILFLSCNNRMIAQKEICTQILNAVINDTINPSKDSLILIWEGKKGYFYVSDIDKKYFLKEAYEAMKEKGNFYKCGNFNLIYIADSLNSLTPDKDYNCKKKSFPDYTLQTHDDYYGDSYKTHDWDKIWRFVYIDGKLYIDMPESQKYPYLKKYFEVLPKQ
jgi:hypothetical protein